MYSFFMHCFLAEKPTSMSAKAAKVKISDPDAASWWAETFPDQNKVDNQEFKSAILARFDDINDEVTEAHEDIVDLVVGA